MGEECGVKMELIARIHGGAGSECSLVRGRGEKGEGKKEGRGKKASDLVKLFARNRRKKRVAIS